jgi:hypothetical protein
MQGIKPTQLEQESTYEPPVLTQQHLITNNQLTQLILNQEGNQIGSVCVCYLKYRKWANSLFLLLIPVLLLLLPLFPVGCNVW